MDNALSFSELILKFWDTILQLIWPIYFRNEGFYIIRKTYGKPGKIYKDNNRWCWKIPLLQKFDIIDMRYHTFNSTAHSFGYNIGNIIPYNLVIDTQVEFRIKDPCIIYKLNNDFSNQMNPLYSFVSNQVHQLLSLCCNNFKLDPKVDLDKIQESIDNELRTANKADETFYKGIEIRKIIITSFDYNISLRQIQ